MRPLCDNKHACQGVSPPHNTMQSWRRSVKCMKMFAKT